MPLEQLAIAVLGFVAAWLSQDGRETRRRWACLFGIAGTPFWLYASWQGAQWGVFALSVLYGVAWLRGVWGGWLRPRWAAEAAER